MTILKTLRGIKDAINAAPRNSYVAELHLQVIKHADELKDVTGREFCNSIGISEVYGTEFLKMRKISDRLIKAGLNPSMI